MRGSELLRLVWLNINQNRFKAIMTSIGIIVGAATILLVIGIGRGGQMDIAEQFAELNAGAIDITYEYKGEDATTSDGGFSFGKMAEFFSSRFGGMFGGGMPDAAGSSSAGSSDGGTGSAPSGGGFPSGNPGENAGDGSGMAAPGAGGGMPQGSGGAPEGSRSDGSADSGSGRTERNANSGDGQTNGAVNSDHGQSDGTANSDSGQSDGIKNSDAGRPGQAADSGNEQAEEADGSSGRTGDEAASDGNASGAADEAETEESQIADRLNQEAITLTSDDVDAIETYVSGISGAAISYTMRVSVEGGVLTDAQTWTAAGVEENFAEAGRLTLAAGDFLTAEEDDARSRVCVLGASAAAGLFEDAKEAVGSTLYIEDRSYTVIGVLETSNTVVSGISVDTALLLPYQTGIKYIAGTTIDPTVTVIAENVNTLQSVIADVKTVLLERYPNADFTFADSGSKMKAAEASNQTLTLLLSAMAAIVFFVGGIGIMNVLFVSVKERTNEIGILKAIGTPRSVILLEFLLESAAISLIGGMLGVGIGFGIIPAVRQFDVRVEPNLQACLAALGFAVLTGTLFGLYPAWKASRLEPVEALNAE